MCLLDCQRRMLQHLPFLLLKVFLHRHTNFNDYTCYLLNVKIFFSSSLCIFCIMCKI